MNKTIRILLILGLFCVAGYYTLDGFMKKPELNKSTGGDKLVSAETSASGLNSYRISVQDSKAEFSINEILKGKPFTAVGSTNQLDGVILVNKSVAQPTIIPQEIKIDASTFKTDNLMRDNALRKMILKTDVPGNQFISLNLKNVSGVPTVITEGDSLNLTVSGDVTISGVTKPETFKALVKVTDQKITGVISGELKRSDFGLVIPNLPFVSDVPDNFNVDVSFVAYKI